VTAIGEGAAAVRHATAWVSARAATVLRVRGAGAFAALDRLLPCELQLYDGAARPTVIVDDDGRAAADVTVARLEDGYALFVEGLPAAEVLDRVAEATPAGAAVDVRDELEGAELVSLHGPFAWELAAAWLGRFVVGLPPLAVASSGGATLLRTGRTGEFGYEVLVPRADAEEKLARLAELGRGFDLARVPQESVDRCTLEAGGFVARRERLAALSPIELQLQWRLSARKNHRGRAGLDRRRAAATHRITWFRSPTTLDVDTPVRLGEDPVGVVLTCEPLSRGSGSGGIALLERRIAHAGIELATDEGPLTTASAPLVEPLSAQVRTHSDAFATRDAKRFPRAVAP
jgi:glycine cleavage system aminomethyltransferase T